MSDNDRYAMLIGVSTYDSDAYHDLPPVRADLHYMRAVLENTEIGMFNDCAMVAEPTRAGMLHAIESFLEERQQSETALLYFSGHGEFCEADNQLYFLTRDTNPDDLPGTAVPAEFLERMLQSCRASAKVVLLPPGQDPARYLRLTHARGDLLTGLPSGGYGAKACAVGRTVRVPAWRILAGEDLLAPLFG